MADQKKRTLSHPEKKSDEAKSENQSLKYPNGTIERDGKMYVPYELWERTNSNLRKLQKDRNQAASRGPDPKSVMAKTSQIRFTGDDVEITRYVPTQVEGLKLPQTLSFNAQRKELLERFKDNPDVLAQIPPPLPDEFLKISGFLSKIVGPIKAMAEGKDILLHVTESTVRNEKGKPLKDDSGKEMREYKISSIIHQAAQAYQKLLRNGTYRWLLEALDKYCQDSNMTPEDLQKSLLGIEPSPQDGQRIAQQASAETNGPTM